MSKNILTEKVINPNNMNELIDLFLYEKLTQIRKEINEQEMLIFFDHYFKTPIPQRQLNYFVEQLKLRLKLMIAQGKNDLQRKGYELTDND